MNQQPVGFFDSGLGGASVLREALKRMPTENYIYYGDNVRAPYGDRSEEEITKFTLECADVLIKKGAKAIVIACNTATATCIGKIREKYAVPVVSVEPAIKPACSQPGSGKILMAATTATTRLERYLKLQSRMPEPERVINVPCPRLVERIEAGIVDPAAYDDLFDSYFSPYHGMQIDGIVLGCTHYIFIKEAFARYAKLHFKGHATLYDGNAATARQLERVLSQNGLLNPSGSGRVEFFTSGDTAQLEPIFSRFIAPEEA